jgi:hypothetical protein
MWATFIAVAIAAGISVSVVSLATQMNQIKNAQSFNAIGSAELHQQLRHPGPAESGNL